ncbi:TPA: hypothetical protein ACGXP4_005489 [Bacillus cereus]
METQRKEIPLGNEEQKKEFLEKEYTLALSGEVTTSLIFRNISTKYIVKIAIAQAYDKDGNTTGPIVIANELKPNVFATTPIDQLNFRAVKASCSYTWRYIETGYEDSADAPDVVAHSGDYLRDPEWGIQDPTSFNGQAEIPVKPATI